MSNKLDKVKVTNSGYLRICRDCKECVNNLTDLPTENVEKDTIYFVYDKEKYYSWTGTEWVESGGEYNLAGEGGGSGSEITIGENGNWFIDGVDTGQPSRGEQGEQGIQGETGPQGPQGEPGSDATVTVDKDLSSTSTNPLQNSTITAIIKEIPIMKIQTGVRTINVDTPQWVRIDVEFSEPFIEIPFVCVNWWHVYRLESLVYLGASTSGCSYLAYVSDPNVDIHTYWQAIGKVNL